MQGAPCAAGWPKKGKKIVKITSRGKKKNVINVGNAEKQGGTQQMLALEKYVPPVVAGKRDSV